ncbi:MAG: hypothetical protein QG646_1041 [Euryarchaeota archaeon]|nr:hypothetical protein [Euryarchaeota archaeon]
MGFIREEKIIDIGKLKNVLFHLTENERIKADSA